MTNDVMSLLAIYKSSVVNYLFKCFTHYFLLGSLLYNFYIIVDYGGFCKYSGS